MRGRRHIGASVVLGVALLLAGLALTVDQSPGSEAVQARAARWYVVTAVRGRNTDRIARHYRARHIGPAAAALFRVRAKWVTPMIRALRKVDAFIQVDPDSGASRTQGPAGDPLDPWATWRPVVVAANVTPP